MIPDHRQGRQDSLDPGVGHFDRFGAEPRILGPSMDVTKQVEARNQLPDSGSFLEASILVWIPHAVIGLKNRQISSPTTASSRSSGSKRAEVIGKSTAVFLPLEEGNRASGRTDLYRSLETRRTFSAEVVRPKDGTLIIYRLTPCGRSGAHREKGRHHLQGHHEPETARKST